MRTALTIAGSDSGGGAGIQADLKTFAAHGVYGTSAITALTAQSTVGVAGVWPVPAEFVTLQIETVAGDLGCDAVKTGMLASAVIVEAVAAAIAALDLPNLVVDPVMVAKSGDHLLTPDAVHALRLTLLPLARVVTPNIPEAGVLAGMTVTSLADAREAARRIHALGPEVVIVKGGHLEGDVLTDVIFDGDRVVELTGPRVPGRHTHGTGCTFAAAVAARLACGDTVEAAARAAKAYVAGAMRAGIPLGQGHRPLDHFWAMPRPAAAGPSGGGG
ncbi:MAG: bifunctional hydroxymethylpyrimidine kinase/phosphomethylpyrimidine kinase [Vicinamibacterales bacterium]|nr:bifunctional hydroxymethylpyrimidine kinase/phosphomethylpyrimidine kinase [Vicinamibacterales bacterium]